VPWNALLPGYTSSTAAVKFHEAPSQPFSHLFTPRYTITPRQSCSPLLVPRPCLYPIAVTPRHSCALSLSLHAHACILLPSLPVTLVPSHYHSTVILVSYCRHCPSITPPFLLNPVTSTLRSVPPPSGFLDPCCLGFRVSGLGFRV
jgi:hypothetical protein